MLARIPRYPRQFWLLFSGYIINRTGNGLIWPFLTIYIRRQLNVPLTTVALLLSIQAVSGLIATTFVGWLMDRFGRKFMMAAGLLGTGLVLLGMRSASTIEVWAILVALYGIVNPVFTVGSNAMIADVVEPDQRAGAYALMRMAQNIGVAIGPAIGGLLISGFMIGKELIVPPYGLTYLITAAVNFVLVALILGMLSETLPEPKTEMIVDGNGFNKLLRDRPFLTFCGVFVLLEMVNTLVFNLLSVYVKENYGILENHYGFIVTINAVMVVFLQYFVTRITIRYKPLPVMALGALFYAVGVLSISLGRGFPTFALSMVIITTGELIVSPTGLALVARLAPPDMRARYMGVYTLTWTIASGTAPVIGGLLNDRIAPVAIWYGGFVIGLSAAAGFYLMARTRLVEDDQPGKDHLAPAVVP